jgi:fermentation-respiration switch protein FrsA (DUF1100 family)
MGSAQTQFPWRRVFFFGLLATLGYLTVLVYLLATETELIYHPTSAEVSWREPASRTVREVEFPSEVSANIHAWWCPAEGASGAVLYCHGNGGNLSNWADHVEMVRKELGESVLIFDYPGYGKSKGSPDEKGCYAATEAAFNWLVGQARIPPERILIYGGSLGGGPAVALASRRPHRALLLACTFTSLPNVAQAAFPWLPVAPLMRNRYDNLSKIGRCRGPVVIAHGTEDTLFPFAHGRALIEAAAEPKLFIPLPGAGHVDPDASFFRWARQFLERVEQAGANDNAE